MPTLKLQTESETNDYGIPELKGELRVERITNQ